VTDIYEDEQFDIGDSTPAHCFLHVRVQIRCVVSVDLNPQHSFATDFNQKLPHVYVFSMFHFLFGTLSNIPAVTYLASIGVRQTNRESSSPSG
jgi:hypothetical protein